MRKEFRFGSITLPTTNHILEGSYIIDMYVCMYIYYVQGVPEFLFVLLNPLQSIPMLARDGWKTIRNYPKKNLVYSSILLASQ